ncbi:MAG TPA: hypothetical protein VNN06_14920, partial [Ramlibacter sp.]|nr:hypothetical protein [Ramlibacter sp.]
PRALAMRRLDGLGQLPAIFKADHSASPSSLLKIASTFLPLLNSQWVPSAGFRRWGAVKGGRSPAQRTLDSDAAPIG